MKDNHSVSCNGSKLSSDEMGAKVVLQCFQPFPLFNLPVKMKLFSSTDKRERTQSLADLEIVQESSTKKRPPSSPVQETPTGRRFRTNSPRNPGSLNCETVGSQSVTEDEVIEEEIVSKIDDLPANKASKNDFETKNPILNTETKEVNASQNKEEDQVCQDNNGDQMDQDELFFIDESQQPTLIQGEENKVFLAMIKEAVDAAIKPMILQLSVLTRSVTEAARREKICCKSNPTNLSFAQAARLKPIPLIPMPAQDIRQTAGSEQPAFTNLQMGQKYLQPQMNVPTHDASAEPQKKVDNPAYELARKVQGFHPITSIDIEKASGICSDDMTEIEKFQKVGMFCIKQFLVRELDMSKRVAADMRIKNVFYPPAGAASATLYAEFYSKEEVSTVRKYVKNLRCTDEYKAKLVPFVPRSLQERYNAVEAVAYKIRSENRKKITTRIWITNDIELRTRQWNDNRPWVEIEPMEIPNLPKQAPKRFKQPNDVWDSNTPQTPFLTSQNNQSSPYQGQFFNLKDNCTD